MSSGIGSGIGLKQKFYRALSNKPLLLARYQGAQRCALVDRLAVQQNRETLDSARVGGRSGSFGVRTLYVHFYMSEIRFEWDQRKAKSNEKKHGISFDEASSAFYDDDGLVIEDPEHSEVEGRFILLALSAAVRLVVVVHCFRDEDDVIRIISARKATPAESRQYPAEATS
jgi:uncharacterized protein